MLAVDLYASGSTEPWTANILRALVEAAKPAMLLELGCFVGLTTETLARAKPIGSHLVSLDADPERALVAATRVAAYENVEVLTSDSIEFLRSQAPASFDFAFVDDDHDPDHVSQELKLLRPLMRPNGIIAVHDVDGPFGLQQVVEAHGGFCLRLPKLHVAGGLGIIQARAE